MSLSGKARGITERATPSPSAVSDSAGGDNNHPQLEVWRDLWRIPLLVVWPDDWRIQPLVGAERAD